MSGTQIQLYQTDNGPCPYREQGNWHNISFQASVLSPENYVTLLDRGFRRSGLSVYHPVCTGCEACIPIRTDVLNFKASKSQRKTWRKNRDVRIEHHPCGFDSIDYSLYKRYQEHWHQSENPVDEMDYFDFLVSTPVPTEIQRYYLGDKLIGVSWVDQLPNIISSVYFVFDPDYSDRRLGVFSLLYEIEYARFMDKRWVYLGYWVEDSQKMGYKADYQPAEILKDSEWIPFENNTDN